VAGVNRRGAWTPDEAAELDVRPPMPDGSTIVSEVFFAEDGTVVDTADEAATIEVHRILADGTEETTYLTRNGAQSPLGDS